MLANCLILHVPVNFLILSNEFNFIIIDVDFIYKQINGPKCKSNVDILGIDSKLIKLGASALAPSLTHIFNESITSGNIPDEWKCAKVTPIFKGKGSPEQCCNYRPISVTSHVSKLMEKAVLYQLNEYILSRDFITCHQYAFRKNHSTTMAIYKVVCDILEGFNENEVTALCFIDLQKCFDTIDHSILIRKLQLYGIKDVTLDWFCNYLRGRKQCVRINGENSSFLNVLMGLPQGSLLGPIL